MYKLQRRAEARLGPKGRPTLLTAISATHMTRKHLFVMAAAGILFAVFGSKGAVGQTVRVSGTNVSLEPPAGFSPAERFPGFQRVDLQASILVTELPAPVSEMKKGMTKEALASKGMTLLSSSTEKVADGEGLLLRVAQKAAGAEFLKWMLIAGDQKTSVMIVGAFPQSAREELDAAIKTSVLSASWRPESAADAFEGLTFRLMPSPKLKLAGRVGNMLMLTESGNTGPVGPKEALYIVGSSVSDIRIPDLRYFSETRARQTAQTTGVANFRGRALKVGGLEAYELVADAKDARTGTAMLLYQIIAPEAGGYFIIQGLVEVERAAEVLPEFRRVTETFRKAAANEASRPTRQ